MIKTLLIVLVVLGFAWAYGPTRARIVHGLEPVLVKLGPVGDRIIQPVQKYSTNQEIEFILSQITLSRTEGREVPDAKSFHRWLSRRVVTKNNGADPWGHRYYLIRTSNALTIGSVGVDGQQGTSDDIRRSIPF